MADSPSKQTLLDDINTTNSATITTPLVQTDVAFNAVGANTVDPSNGNDTQATVAPLAGGTLDGTVETVTVTYTRKDLTALFTDAGISTITVAPDGIATIGDVLHAVNVKYGTKIEDSDIQSLEDVVDTTQAPVTLNATDTSLVYKGNFTVTTTAPAVQLSSLITTPVLNGLDPLLQPSELIVDPVVTNTTTVANDGGFLYWPSSGGPHVTPASPFNTVSNGELVLGLSAYVPDGAITTTVDATGATVIVQSTDTWQLLFSVDMDPSLTSVGPVYSVYHTTLDIATKDGTAHTSLVLVKDTDSSNSVWQAQDIGAPDLTDNGQSSVGDLVTVQNVKDIGTFPAFTALPKNAAGGLVGDFVATLTAYRVNTLGAPFSITLPITVSAGSVPPPV